MALKFLRRRNNLSRQKQRAVLLYSPICLFVGRGVNRNNFSNDHRTIFVEKSSLKWAEFFLFLIFLKSAEFFSTDALKLR